MVSHGRCGYLFQPGNVHELADLLNKLSSSPELGVKLANRALYDAKGKFSPKNHFTLLVDIYYEAISKFHQK